MNKIILVTLLKTAIVFIFSILISFWFVSRIVYPCMMQLLGNSQLPILSFCIASFFLVYGLCISLELSLMLLGSLPIEKILNRLFGIRNTNHV
jgi:hydrogenase/urease accessory protein HupE